MGKRLLVLMAHPDDAEILCYGTIRKYISAGWECRIAIATDGSRGACDRMKETGAAFADVNVSICCLELEDGNIQFSIDSISRIRDEIDRYSPNCIITHFPETSGIEHQDHIAVGKAVINSAFRTSGVLEKVLLAEPLLISGTSFTANYYVDITDWYENKLMALSKHVSQKEKFYMSESFSDLRAHQYSHLLMDKDKSRCYEAFQALFVVER